MPSRNNIPKKKVIVAMSGGVDSSAAAALLKKEGYNVMGVFMKFWSSYAKASDDKHDRIIQENKCCSLESAQGARRTANQLGIPFYVINAGREFKKEVVDYFISEYKKGRTPNPCMVCNREIKFKILFQKLIALKADFVATGHYARLHQELPITKFKIPNKFKNQNSKFHLLEARDRKKDQSYFLYTLSQKQLAKIIFPLGNLMKQKVRQLAQKFNLSVHNKKESQDVCFIAERNVTDFLKKYIKVKPGIIVNQNKEVLGKHNGLAFYTLGQRKGINLGGNGPYYVIGKNYKKNQLIITNNKEDKNLYSSEIIVKNVNWIIDKPKFPYKIWVKTRYQNPAVGAIIRPKGNNYVIKLGKPQRAVTPGQSAVFYSKKQEVLGGGIIKKTYG